MPQVTPLPLKQLTTLRTGGAPARMIDAHTTEELVDALREVWAGGDDWFVLGGGSNLFVGDEPYDGTVIRILTNGIETLASPNPGHVRVRVQAGHNWDDFVAWTVETGLAGVEAMSGIPGTVGAAPVQNVGAYGQETVQTLVEVELFDEGDENPVTVPAADLELGFRTSVLKNHYGDIAPRRAVILSATFELEMVGHAERVVRGEQLRAALGLDADQAVSIQWIRDHVLATRARKGMVLDDADPDTYSAGSFFQNAVVTAAFARTLPDECPRWPVAPDPNPVQVIALAEFTGAVPPLATSEPDVKVSCGWLIEHAGIGKGFHLPRSRAGLSTKHALALTNRGGASAAEIAELARYIRGRVSAEFGLEMQPEPVLIGVEL
ncbi:UDP-N-acetylenolpyruvoylglucosamine reductase [Microbacterium mangrovi]|uniref:UDP-N-acetylenolpyruvoylglucosamine reductase n=1 Tax=Microbacterium mangrovi TaxID=1348253 RepID=A0A0B2A8T6_9MICO|nr:UDP-N-acetylmuramate dehydrogenase [Microbacterium mangrovi]KHK98046.1 UDP-N-acetylenolpyruvoylglucosamine reductase [Microbacterium mangrovi]